MDAFNEMLAGIQSRDNELKKALAAREEAFEEAETARNSLQTTLASIGDAVISTDVEGRVVFANPVAQALLRLAGGGDPGRPIDEVFRIFNEFRPRPSGEPGDKGTSRGERRRAGQAHDPDRAGRHGNSDRQQRRADPTRGRTVGVVLVFRDVSERRRAERDAAYLAALVESSGDAIIGSSPEGVIQSWNAGAERLYGYRAEEMIGHSTRELTPADRRARGIGHLRKRCGREIAWSTWRQCGSVKGGALVDVSLTISPIRDETGQIMGISHLARDITEQKKNAEQLRQTQKLESIGILAGASRTTSTTCSPALWATPAWRSMNSARTRA